MQHAGITPKRLTIAAVAAFVITIVWLGFAPMAEAGTYHVWECAASQGGPAAGPDVGNNNFGQSTGNAPGYAAYNECASGSPSGPYSHAFGIQAVEGAVAGTYRAFDIIAPPGTRFLNGSLEVNLFGISGHQPLVSLGNQSFLQTHIASSSGGWQNLAWSAPDSSTNQLVVWLVCAHSGGYCPEVGGYTTAYAKNLVFNVQDYTAPSVSIGGSLTGGGWRNSGGTLSVSGGDSGGGVYFVDQYLNGGHVRRDFGSCSTTTLFGGTVGTQLTPCSTSAASGGVSYGTGSFSQGANTYTGCAHDFASDGSTSNGSCTSDTVYIDTVAPGGIDGLAVAGGSGWRPTNDFDLSWANPAQAHAPVDGYYYRLTKVGGGYDSGAQYVSGAASSRPDVAVPSAGEFQAKIWLRDSAGNQSEANAQTAVLRYDPTVPPAAEAQFNGWIRRNDFEYTADWQEVNPNAIGPSGLDGYAVAVTQDPASDPCVTDLHPSPSCSADEVNNDGINDTEMAVDERAEGDWYIHVAPVTGAGVKAPIEHTQMPVDTSDPSTAISGASGEWTNQSVTLAVAATDALSGMSPNLAYSVDPQPRTCLQVGAAAVECEPDADLTRVVEAEGEHTVRYYARDLAGNDNNGQPDINGHTNNPANTATVRIDKSAPQLAFVAGRDVHDPAKIVASATDALSGVVGGTIELRRQGSGGSWVGLQTTLEGSSLAGRVPDEIDPGRYEFRASASDRAGNTGSSGLRADGSQMVEELPLKEGVRLSATIEGAQAAAEPPKGKCKKAVLAKKKCCKGTKAKGKCKGSKRAATIVRVPYGTEVRLKGVLRTLGDAPLRGRDVTVTEHLADGGTPATRSRTTSTDGDGQYEIGLDAGPSRTVTVFFAGDQRYQPSESDQVELAVAAKVLSFRSPKTVPETKAIRFRGQLGVAGVKLGPEGKRIELQYLKSRKNWQTIDAGQTDGQGGFGIVYPLRSDYVRKTRVRFRVLVPPEGGWPYAGTATSRGRRTVILP